MYVEYCISFLYSCLYLHLWQKIAHFLHTLSSVIRTLASLLSQIKGEPSLFQRVKATGKKAEKKMQWKASVEDLLVFQFSTAEWQFCYAFPISSSWVGRPVERIGEWLMGTKMIISNMPKSSLLFFFYSQQRIECMND